MTERKQDSLTEKFLDSLIEDNQFQIEKDEITLELKTSPEVEDDVSFSNLANRIVDEVISSRSHTDLAKRVLSQAGINTNDGPAEPQVFNGHLRHVGKRARKIAHKEIAPFRKINNTLIPSSAKAAAVLVLLYPLVDLLRVFILRIKDGKSPFIADQRHIHHYLHNKFKSHFASIFIIFLLHILILIITYIYQIGF